MTNRTKEKRPPVPFKDPEKQREAERKWREENRERVRANQKRWADKNRERLRRESKEDAAREYRRQYWTKAKYGLTLPEYHEIIGRGYHEGCAICGNTEEKIVLDHDHATGKVRDALCNSCNVGLGSFADDPERLELAAAYLRAHS